MSGIEIILLGVALSMDAFAVTISNMFSYRGTSTRRALWMPIFFGFFQGFMPFLGYLVGSLVSSVIEQFAGILTFVILGFIGAKMIWDAFHENEEDPATKDEVSFSVLFFQAIATSIDALAVGVSLAALSVNIIFAASVIAIVTALCCCVALLIGKRFGTALGNKAAIIGGVILILIGLRSLIF